MLKKSSLYLLFPKGIILICQTVHDVIYQRNNLKVKKTKNCEKPTVWNVEGRRTGIELPFCFSNSKTS